MPIDYETEKHRGFAFIEFELQEDAQAAIDNMNDGENVEEKRIYLINYIDLRRNVWTSSES